VTDRHNVRTYYGFDRTAVEVRVEGRGWVAGEVRMRWQDNDGVWWAEVQYRADHHSSRIDAFRADHVRRNDTDHSVSRTVASPRHSH
jgi:hypothetical protein